MSCLLFNRLTNRTTWCVLFLAIFVGWVLFGTSALQRLGDKGPTVEDYVKGQIDHLKAVNPEAGAALAKIARDRDIRAVASSLRVYDRETSGNPVHLLARDLERNEADGLRWYTLSAVGMNKFAHASSQVRNEFFDTQAGVYQNLLDIDPTGVKAGEYAARLAAASGDAAWNVMGSDPAALSFHNALSTDPEAWEYYSREKDWLNDILVSLQIPEGAGIKVESLVLEAVQTARRYAPVFKKVYQSQLNADSELDASFGALLLDVFTKYGDLLVAGDGNGLPAEELVAIAFNNPTEFSYSSEPALRERKIRDDIAWLQIIRTGKPHVWEYAATELNVLWLDRAAPKQAEHILEQYSGGDIPTFLFTYYEDIAATAAQAIVTYGDLGIYALNRYSEDQDFHRHLADQRAGIRIVPFMLRYPEEGFTMLRNNDYRWIDRYFNSDGSQKDEGWVKGIPLIGAPISVVDNWVNGMPNTWGELGWAAFDVADTALIIATFGSSATVTQGAKQAGKQAIKSRAKRSAAKAVASRAVAGRTVAGRTVARTTVRTLGKRAGQSLLVRLAKSGYQTIRWAAAAPISAGKYVWRSTRGAWRSLSPTMRRVITGTAAAIMLLYAADSRNSLEALERAFEALGKKAGQLVHAVGSGVVSGLTQAVNEVLGGAGDSLSAPARRWIWYGGMAGLAVMVYVLRPSRRDIAAYRKGI